ncbi:MAG: fibrillarin-like rRNA/tRNA 2'-O-methyltransferase [Thermoplasmatota archaeon]
MADEKGRFRYLVEGRLINIENKVYTLDREGGRSVYGESLLELDGAAWREWIPWRSKLGALFTKRPGMTLKFEGDVLYLGAAQGTTVSHISDLLEGGAIYAVEFSRAPFIKLSDLSRKRDNIVPILEDAFHPERYRAIVPTVSTVYQDVAQKEQLEMFLLNCGIFLRPGGLGVLMLKSRSVDVTARPSEIFEKVSSGLVKDGFTILETVDLSPYQIDHFAFVLRRKGP